ncbi:MAG: acyltransferase [Gammaproteobacteria bacterium]|nr:acyltransferase [Gammaproteobacteria bacterium]
MRFAGYGVIGRGAMSMAGWFYPPYKARHDLARMSEIGYISPSVCIHARNITLGKNIFLGDGVTIFNRGSSESVTLGNEVAINKDTILESGKGGHIFIGDRTTIQPRCQLSAYVGTIRIGADVQIALNCAFYPYNHGMSLDKTMKEQPLFSQGGIDIGDDVWLGVGVVVLDGVHIGQGAIIGAGSVVNKNIPAGVLAAGVPARIIKERENNGR